MYFYSSIPVSASNGQQEDLIGHFYNIFKDDKNKRIEVLKILTGTEQLEKPYKIQEITDSNVSDIADTLNAQLEDNRLSKSTIENALKSLYKLQQKSETILSLILEKFNKDYKFLMINIMEIFLI